MKLTEQSFATYLRETIEWASPRIDVNAPRWCLRSEELRPPSNEWDDNNPGLFNQTKYIQYVSTTRSQLLSAHLSADSVSEGRLLVVDYNITNHNGATEIESDGFFDWADNPPWDLWVCELHETLVCWIPAVFTDVVTRAMEIELFDVLHWVTSENARAGRHPQWMTQYNQDC